jgi:heme oxygenase (mycobilin-producing)
MKIIAYGSYFAGDKVLKMEYLSICFILELEASKGVEFIMKIYITTGTLDYLMKLKNDYPTEKMLLLEGEDYAVLLHETAGEPLFNEPRKYDVLDSTGDFGGKFAVFNNIPVTEEGRPIFEYRFSQRARLIEKEPGFVAIRVLRPLSNDTYIIMTLWESEKHFKGWQQSKAHQKRGKQEEIIQQKTIFPRPSYVTTYIIPKQN